MHTNRKEYWIVSQVKKTNITDEDNKDENSNIPPTDSASNDNVAFNVVEVSLFHVLNVIKFAFVDTS